MTGVDTVVASGSNSNSVKIFAISARAPTRTGVPGGKQSAA